MVKYPVVKYYGGKFRLAPWISSFFPAHHCYVELFGGAASVLMHKRPSRVEVYNDRNDEMVNLFRVLRDDHSTEQLQRLLELTPYSRVEFKAATERVEDAIEQARRTIVLSSMAMNVGKALNRKGSAFRTSSKMHHQYPLKLMDYTDNIKEFTQRLRHVIIENRSYEDLIAQHDSYRTVFYVDPPYLTSERSYKVDQYAFEFNTPEQHEQLAKRLHKVKGMVIISHYDCPQYKKWYEDHGWIRHSKKSTTGAAKKGNSSRNECIWLNPACAAAQAQMTLW